MDHKKLIDWISKTTMTDISTQLFESLSDGKILVKLVNALLNKEYKVKDPKNVYERMANINTFLSAAKEIGVPDQELFMSSDLANMSNSRQVEICLYSLNRHAFAKNLTDDLIGPKLVEKTNFVFNEDVIVKGKMHIPLQNAGSLDPKLKISVGGRERFGIPESKIDNEKNNI
ncbi:Transgelin-3 [Gurleya vavrai]